MTVRISLSADAEARLRARAAAAGQDPETYVLQVVENELADDNGASGRPHVERLAALREWVASLKPLPYVADDSRESIYEGRGE